MTPDYSKANQCKGRDYYEQIQCDTIKSLKAQLSSLRAENEKLAKIIHDERNQVQAKIAEALNPMVEDLKNLNKENERLKEAERMQTEAIKTQSRENDKLRADNERLKGTIEVLRQERTRYEKQYHGIIDENDSLKASVKQLLDMNDSAKNELRKKGYGWTGLDLIKTVELVGKEDEIGQLKSDLYHAQSNLEIAGKRCEDMEALIKDMAYSQIRYGHITGRHINKANELGIETEKTL